MSLSIAEILGDGGSDDEGEEGESGSGSGSDSENSSEDEEGKTVNLAQTLCVVANSITDFISLNFE